MGVDVEQDYAPPSMERRKGWKADLNNLGHGREKGLTSDDPESEGKEMRHKVARQQCSCSILT